MDVTELTRLINKALEQEPFSISGNLLGSPSIATCLTAFFGSDALELTGASLKSSSSTEVVVGGQMTQELAGLQDRQATVTFTVPDAEAQFVLALSTLPDGWVPSASFVQLKGSVFDEFAWSDPVLTLSSAGGPPLPAGYPTGLGYPAYPAAMAKAMKFGLGLSATVTPRAGGGPLEWLLTGTAWQVSGPIVLPAAQLSAVLSTAPQPGVSVGGFSIPFAFTIASAAIQPKPTDPIVVASVLQLDAEVDRDLGGGTVFKLPFLVREGTAAAPIVTVQSALPPGHGITPDEIGALIGTGIGDQVPHSFPALDEIQLERVALTLAPAAQQPLTSVSATIGWVTPKPYPIFGGLITFNGMAVTFTYLPAGYSRPDGSVWHVMADVVTQATVAGGTLEADLALPDLVFSCVLEEGTSIDITELVRAAAGDSISMPQINCTELAIFGDVTSSTYRFQATVTDDWQFTIGSKPLALTQIGMDIDKDANGFGGEIICRFDIAGTKLFGRAGYESATTGWTFELGTIEKADVSLTDLAGELLELLGLQLPDNAPQLTLTALNFAFDSAAETFRFQCATALKIAGTEVDMGLEIATGLFRGMLWVGDSYFEIDFSSSDQSKSLFATWKAPDPKGYLQFEDIAAVFGWQMPAVPAKLDLALKDAELLYLFDTGTLAVSAHSANYGQVLFVSLGADAAVAGNGGKPVYFFSLDVPLNVQLTDLPVVGSKLPAGLRLGIKDLELILVSAALDEKRVPALNKAIEGLGDKAIIPTSLSAGATFAAGLEMGASTEPIVVPLSGGSSRQLPAPAAALPVPAAAPPPADASATLKWFDVGKQFGVFSFQRLGVGFHDGELEFGLDASLAVGPIGFSVEALTVSAPLKPPPFKPHFDFKGLALSFDRPPVSIGGEFLKVPEVVDGETVVSFYGEILVTAASFSLKALGGWRPTPPPFFFLYLNIDVPIGGPPFLFVTGLAGGFGINSSLVLPSIDEVASYPLLPAKAPPAKGTPAETIEKVLPELRKTFKPEAGEYWVAAGVQFTTFEMVASQVVLSVAFGVEVQVGVVGTSAMTFPTGDPAPVAYVEVDIVASFTPSTGLLAVDGKLSPASYLFGGFVKLTGGFAFYAWFSGDHKGDFVVSLGGYHPAFDKPSNYPVVPRLALGFSLGPLKVQGQSYFALTPGAFMAGIRMSATFAAGPIKAWFDAGADFLIEWAPFHYEADAYVVFGCSVDLGLFTLTVHVGAALEIWGPAFGGRALIDLDIVSFTIGFGAHRAAPPPVGWRTLSENFLPPPQSAPAPRVATLAAAADPPPATPNSITATVTAGRRAVTAASVDWIIDPDHFRIATSSTVPANHALWGVGESTTDELPNVAADYKRLPRPVEAAATAVVPKDMELALDWDAVTYADLHRGALEAWEPKLNVAPMKKPNVAAYHTVALRQLDPATKTYCYITGLTVAPQLSPSTTALWGPPDSDVKTDPNAERLLPATLTGLALSPVPRHPDQVNPVSLLGLVFGEGNPTGFSYQPPIGPSPYTVGWSKSPDGEKLVIDVSGAHVESLTNTGHELSALVDPWVAGQRSAILDELTQLGFATVPSNSVDLTVMAETALTDWPHAALIGSPA